MLVKDVEIDATSSDSIDLALMGVVTDFTAREDKIFVDPTQVIREFVAVYGNEDDRDFTANFPLTFALSRMPKGRSPILNLPSLQLLSAIR
ncbi:hypothetical protein [Sulfitobacter sp.]|uniref:hypothetical protein n=1 Tax=Sulfitobacter sp. TaxID=1903071 RepID=UPI0030022C9C